MKSSNCESKVTKPGGWWQSCPLPIRLVQFSTMLICASFLLFQHQIQCWLISSMDTKFTFSVTLSYSLLVYHLNSLQLNSLMCSSCIFTDSRNSSFTAVFAKGSLQCEFIRESAFKSLFSCALISLVVATEPAKVPQNIHAQKYLATKRSQTTFIIYTNMS
jgi:hypothetical protein